MAVVKLCRALVRGMSWLEAIELAQAKRDPATVAAFHTRDQLPQSRSGFAPYVLDIAVHILHIINPLFSLFLYFSLCFNISADEDFVANPSLILFRIASIVFLIAFKSFK